jgi:general secretion pathway protein B
MSYILDALRKSDQQRQRGAAPTLLTMQPAAVVRKRPAFLAYGLLAAVLVGAGIVIGWLRPWQSEPAVPARPEPVAAKPLESTPRQPAPAPSEIAPQPNQEPKPELQARVKPKADGAQRKADAAAPGRKAAPAPDRLAYTAAGDAEDAPAVISMTELPPSIQQDLPKMTITVHAYSDKPGARLVGINNRILREGDYVVPGLELEEITPDGMIFGYKGYRFRRGLK